MKGAIVYPDAFHAMTATIFMLSVFGSVCRRVTGPDAAHFRRPVSFRSVGWRLFFTRLPFSRLPLACEAVFFGRGESRTINPRPHSSFEIRVMTIDFLFIRYHSGLFALSSAAHFLREIFDPNRARRPIRHTRVIKHFSRRNDFRLLIFRSSSLYSTLYCYLARNALLTLHLRYKSPENDLSTLIPRKGFVSNSI